MIDSEQYHFLNYELISNIIKHMKGYKQRKVKISHEVYIIKGQLVSDQIRLNYLQEVNCCNELLRASAQREPSM
jgi:hypothetical protein